MSEAIGSTTPSAPGGLGYPFIFRRYVSTLIDGLLLLTIILVVPQFLQGEGNGFQVARISLFVLVLLYEPVLTAFGYTLGQGMMKMRVRRADDVTRPISLPAAYLRWLVKGFLGFISFFSMRAANRNRALHDLAAGSVMINVA